MAAWGNHWGNKSGHGYADEDRRIMAARHLLSLVEGTDQSQHACYINSMAVAKDGRDLGAGMDDHHYVELVGIATAAASLYAANSKTIIPLRVAAIVANALAMAYSFLHGTYPTLALNAVLLPLNAWRLHGMLKLIRDIDVAAKSDMNAQWLLPYMRPRAFKAGDIMMRRGERARDAFYVTAGEVEIVEVGKIVGSDTLLGEIGLFTPDGLRTMTARCKTDVEAARIDYDQFKQLCFQNPEFGFRLLHLIVGRLSETNALPRTPA